MPVAIDATVMGASANSYITLAEAETILEGVLDVTSWSTATDPTKNQALVSATQELENQQYRGWPSTTTQALAWPRNGLYKDGGAPWPYLTIPAPVKRAEALLALQLVQDYVAGTVAAAEETADLKSFSIGPLAVTWKDTVSTAIVGRLPVDVRQVLAQFLLGAGDQFAILRG